MENQEFILKSGASLKITISSYRDAWALTSSILESLKGLELKEKDLNINMDFKNPKNMLKGGSNLLSQIIDKVLTVAVSSKVEEAIFRCGTRALYNENYKVNKELLDDLEIGLQVREDFFEICYRIIEVNCFPFFKKTFSGLTNVVQQKPESNQK